MNSLVSLWTRGWMTPENKKKQNWNIFSWNTCCWYYYSVVLLLVLSSITTILLNNCVAFYYNDFVCFIICLVCYVSRNTMMERINESRILGYPPEWPQAGARAWLWGKSTQVDPTDWSTCSTQAPRSNTTTNISTNRNNVRVSRWQTIHSGRSVNLEPLNTVHTVQCLETINRHFGSSWTFSHWVRTRNGRLTEVPSNTPVTNNINNAFSSGSISPTICQNHWIDWSVSLYPRYSVLARKSSMSASSKAQRISFHNPFQ